jgi:hypothetical protein
MAGRLRPSRPFPSEPGFAPGFFVQENTMAIPEDYRAKFQALLAAAADDWLCLVECVDTANGEPRYVLCAVRGDGAAFIVEPFGHLAEGNPYDLNLPPDRAGPGE